jgi:hypothetical protein
MAAIEIMRTAPAPTVIPGGRCILRPCGGARVRTPGAAPVQPKGDLNHGANSPATAS